MGFHSGSHIGAAGVRGKTHLHRECLHVFDGGPEKTVADVSARSNFRNLG